MYSNKNSKFSLMLFFVRILQSCYVYNSKTNSLTLVCLKLEVDKFPNLAECTKWLEGTSPNYLYLFQGTERCPGQSSLLETISIPPQVWGSGCSTVAASMSTGCPTSQSVSMATVELTRHIARLGSPADPRLAPMQLHQQTQITHSLYLP